MTQDFPQRLRQVREDLTRMGHAVGARLRRTLKALRTRDPQEVRRLIEADGETDVQEVAIERACLDMLASAKRGEADTHALVAFIKVNSDLERVGDMAAHIAERTLALANVDGGDVPEQIDEMGRIACEMLTDAVDAFGRRDTVLADRVRERDDAVDVLNEEVYRAFLEEAARRPDRIELAMQYLIISKTLERIADLATKVARNVTFMATGRIIRHAHEA